MIRILTAAVFAVSLPIAAHAAGGGSDDSPPKPTDTTQTCTNGKVWDAGKKECVAPSRSGLDDDTLYQAARELAYDGQYAHTLAVLDAMSDQQDDRVMTYRGFAHRKAGDVDTGMAYYQAALEINPDNLLVRSYMGQAMVEMGQIDAARAQLTEIRRRGGRGDWPEYSLRNAIGSGQGYSY